MENTEPTYPFSTFYFYVVSRIDDTDRPKVTQTRWLMTVKEASERVERGEWLVAVPSPHRALEVGNRGTRAIPIEEARDQIEAFIRDGKVYGVKPKPEPR